MIEWVAITALGGALAAADSPKRGVHPHAYMRSKERRHLVTVPGPGPLWSTEPSFLFTHYSRARELFEDLAIALNSPKGTGQKVTIEIVHRTTDEYDPLHRARVVLTVTDGEVHVVFAQEVPSAEHWIPGFIFDYFQEEYEWRLQETVGGVAAPDPHNDPPKTHVTDESGELELQAYDRFERSDVQGLEGVFSRIADAPRRLKGLEERFQREMRRDIGAEMYHLANNLAPSVVYERLLGEYGEPTEFMEDAGTDNITTAVRRATKGQLWHDRADRKLVSPILQALEDYVRDNAEVEER
jgi:hypothetical protein